MSFFEKYRAILIFIILWSFVAWLLSFKGLPKESAPEIDLPFYIVTAVYPWWDPETIESQIIDRLESKFSSISKVKEIKSTSAFNLWVISVEFLKSKSEQDALNDLKSAIDSVKWGFPSEVEEPTVWKINLDDSPIYTFSVSWPLKQSVLYDKVYFLEDDLKKIEWVSSVDVIWKQNKEIQIVVDYSKLEQYNISYWQFISSVNGILSRFPADKKFINWTLYSFEVSSYKDDINDVISTISNYNVVTKWNSEVKVSDVAEIFLWLEKLSKQSFIYKDGWKTLSSISYQVKKIPWEDLLSTIVNVKSYLESKKDFFVENDLWFYELSNAKEKIDNTYNTFISNFWQTSVLILIIILLFIWFKESLAISFAFPLVYLMTFIWLNLIWFSFNMIVSFSLILTLWIMVDSLIVITEWVEDALSKWLSKRDAINDALKTYKVPLISWTLTTIVMFLPLYFMLSWNMGEFMKAMPVTVTINLLFALLVALVFLPVIFSFFKLKSSKAVKESVWNFAWFVNFFIKTKFRAVLTIIFFRLSLFWVISLIVMWFIKTDFFAAQDSNNINVNIDYVSWLSLSDNQEKTSIIVSEIDNFLSKNYLWVVDYIWVDLWVKSSSNAMQNTMYWTSWSDNYTTLNIRLLDKDSDRKLLDSNEKSFIIKQELQTYLDNTISIDWLDEIFVSTDKAWPWSGKPIEFNILWEDFNNINDYVDQVLPKLKEIKGTFNWGTNLEYTNWKIKIIWNLNKLKEFGISINDVNLMIFWIQNSLDYTPNSTTVKSMYDIDDDEVKIKSYLDFDWKIEDMKIKWVYLSQLIREIRFLPEIKWISHIDTKIAITVDADKRDDIPTWEIVPEIEKIISKSVFPEGVYFAYWSDIKEQQQSWKDMGMALMTWLILMFWVLVFQFNNFRFPLIIFSSLPLLIIWAFGLLWIMWVAFSFAAQLWMFWLIWVWVNNAILLIESFSEKLSKSNWLVNMDIINDTINSRVKPIFLTTLTTSVWLLTLAMKDEMWASLWIASVWGLVIGSLIMLIYIPAILRLRAKW